MASTAPASPPDHAPDTRTPYERIGGLPTLQRIADRFYDLMEHDPAYAELRALHADDLGPIRAGLAGFLSGWSGGPRDWSAANPGRCMGSIHAPVAITGSSARQWASAMRRAIIDVAPADAEIAEAFASVLERMALAMARD